MRLRLAAGMAAVVGLTTGSTTAHPQPSPPPSAEVHIPVSVREGSRVVAGLVAADFVVTDNGESQTVQVFALERIPADVTLIVDTKHGGMNIAGRFAEDVQQIERLLRKDDRLRLLRIDTFVEELRPMSAGTRTIASAPTWRSNGLSSLHDALVAALVGPSEREREQLIVAITDGFDTMSVTTADRVRELASRSDALLQIVSVRPPAGSRSAPTVLRPRFLDASLLALAEAAEQTGGELRTPGLFGDADLVGSFTRAFNGFRQSYVLRYTPANVEREGWHEVSVTVPRAPNATVRARRGYYGN